MMDWTKEFKTLEEYRLFVLEERNCDCDDCMKWTASEFNIDLEELQKQKEVVYDRKPSIRLDIWI